MKPNHDHHNTHSSNNHLTPYRRLAQMLRLDRGDYLVIVLYTVFIGLLTLVVPLAAQALVNTIAAGVMLQPLVVLTLGVLGALLFAGVLRLMKLSLLEKLQQRVFARVSLQLAEHLPRIEHDVIVSEYSPQLANRFFDVVTIQKTMAKILLDGPAATLQVCVALLLMSFYSPYLLGFAVFLILFIAFVVGVLGIGGLRTSIEESYSKYHVADWLEELARCQRSFKMNAAPNFAIEKADELVVDYVKARREHFSVLFRQAFGNYLFRAVASAGVLAIGGWLVINRQMTLGQIVAAEIVVVGALEGLEKIIRLLETFYDLLTGLDKVGHLTDLPAEHCKGRELPCNPEGASVVCRNVRFAYEGRGEILSNLNLSIEPGQHVSLVGKSGVGKSTLAMLFCGLHEANHGLVQINGMDVRDAHPESLRRSVGLVSDANEVFAGTIEENILLGREDITHEDLQWAIEFAQLTDDLAVLPEGLQTRLVSEGRNLSRGQVQRLLIARAVVSRPQLLILDEGFTGVDENDKLMILEELFNRRHNWTIIDISHDPEVVVRSSKVHVLADGQIAESGRPSELMRVREGSFTKLFPTLGLREVK
ncbi:MAG TPA: ATP-binding cassette domain-containing protein [Blastocatellia bacterium]|nr:ATP-binding cassette domain-containing protein [Blastocatellia bacterium]HMV83831.1 ATP-binding cassette domain-containing protein [Blastocatellia bacterium]HMZ18429.1 ATP-binding cassette domain-containing protein [Blastocatellia bacterium]HNG32650.1 ATP-binding cassette domain-containing protein [Blastocatellia bacterium]